MAFNYEAAKKAGASDDEIINYLTKTRHFDVQGALKAGASKTEIINHLSTSQAPSWKAPAAAPEEKSVGGFLGNVATSAGKFVEGLGHAVMHPVDTTMALSKMGAGALDYAADKLSPELASAPKGDLIEGNRKVFDTVKGVYTDKYGSPSKVVDTLYNDPVGAAADASMVLGGASTLLKTAGEAGKVGTLVRAGEKAGKVAELVDPVTQATRGLGKVAEKVIPAGKEVGFGKTADTAAMSAAERQGVTLPASAANTSPIVATAEAMSAKGLFGKKIMSEIEAAQQKAKSIADDVIASAEGSSDLTTAGKSISEGMRKFRSTFQLMKSKLYERAELPAVGDKASKPIIVQPVQTVDFLKKVLADKQGAADILGSAQDLGFFETMAKGLSKKNLSATKVRAALKELSARANNFNDPISTGNAAILKRIKATLENEFDMALKAQRPDLADALDTANAFYKENVQKLDSTFGKKIAALKDTPDKILPAILSPNTSIEDIPKIFEVAGPEASANIRTAFLSEFFKGAKGAQGDFTPLGLSRQIEKMGRNKLSAILDSNQYQTLMDLETISKALARSSKSLNGSQTAFLARTAVQSSAGIQALASLAHGNYTTFLAALTPVLGDAAMSAFISSPFGRRFLTTGFKLTGKSADVIKNAAPAIGGPMTAASQAGKVEQSTETDR